MLHQKIFRTKSLRKRIKKLMFRINKEVSVKILYRIFIGERLSLDNPLQYNEKLQWMKLNYHNELMVQCADKYRVREYLQDKGYGHILNDLYGVYDKAEYIDFDKLPDKFVLKANHGCGMNIIVDDKSELDIENARIKLDNWLKEDYYWHNAEWVYRGIEAKIIIEKNLSTNKTPPTDYKFYCSDGEARVIVAVRDRNNDLVCNMYDTKWNQLDSMIRYPGRKDRVIEKPELLEEMLEMCKDISADFPHVRVDLYEVDQRIVFGELTFFSGSGYTKLAPASFSRQMGDWIRLPERNV